MLASLSPQCSSSCCNTGSEFPLLSELKTIKRHRVPHNQLVLCRKGSDVRLLSPELLPSPGSVFPCSPWTHPLLAESHSSNNSLHRSFCLQIFCDQSRDIIHGDTHHRVYLASSVSRAVPGFCYDFSSFLSCQFCFPRCGFPLAMPCLEAKCPSCRRSASKVNSANH